MLLPSRPIDAVNRAPAIDPKHSLDAVGDAAQNPRMRHDHHPCFLRRIDPSRNMARFYVLTLQPTLFGEMSLVRSWGRFGTRGREKIELYGTDDEAAAARTKLAMRKRRRGYCDKGTHFGDGGVPVGSHSD